MGELFFILATTIFFGGLVAIAYQTIIHK